jgi:hypothetical protein
MQVDLVIERVSSNKLNADKLKQQMQDIATAADKRQQSQGVKGAQPVAYINVGFGEGVLSLVGMTPRVLVSAQIRQKKTKLKIRGFSVPTTSTPTPPTGAAVQAPTKLRIR